MLYYPRVDIIYIIGYNRIEKALRFAYKYRSNVYIVKFYANITVHLGFALESQMSDTCGSRSHIETAAWGAPYEPTVIYQPVFSFMEIQLFSVFHITHVLMCVPMCTWKGFFLTDICSEIQFRASPTFLVFVKLPQDGLHIYPPPPPARDGSCHRPLPSDVHSDPRGWPAS